MVIPVSERILNAIRDNESKHFELKWMWFLPALTLPFFWFIRSQSQSVIANEPIQEKALPVQVQRLESVSKYQVSRTYTGELVARRSSNLGFEQAGTVVAILVEEGDTVPTGAPIAHLDTRSLKAQRQQLEAQRQQAAALFQELQQGPRQEDIIAAKANVQDLQAQLELASLQQQRRENLYTMGAISLEERDEKAFTVKSLESRLHQAQSQLDALQTGTRIEQITAQNAQVKQIDASIRNLDISLSKSNLYAPFTGQISQRSIDEGAVVVPGQSVVRLVENEALEARIGVPAQMANRLTIGSTQTVEVEAQTIDGIVTALLPELEETSQTVTVVISLPSTTQFNIGLTARLRLQDDQTEAGYWLPTNALVAGERGLWSAYVLTESKENLANGFHTVARREIEVLYTEGNRTFVRGVLRPGDQVITSGTHRIVPGQPVKL